MHAMSDTRTISQLEAEGYCRAAVPKSAVHGGMRRTDLSPRYPAANGSAAARLC